MERIIYTVRCMVSTTQLQPQMYKTVNLFYMLFVCEHILVAFGMDLCNVWKSESIQHTRENLIISSFPFVVVVVCQSPEKSIGWPADICRYLEEISSVKTLLELAFVLLLFINPNVIIELNVVQRQTSFNYFSTSRAYWLQNFPLLA